MFSRHVSTVIEASAKAVYEFVSEPDNLPKWAGGLARSEVIRRGEELIAESPMGTVTVRFVPRNPFGVVDHDVVLPDGAVVHNPLRVLDHPDGAEVVFTLRQRDMSDDEFDRDTRMVEDDLARLKSLLEAREEADGAATGPPMRRLVSSGSPYEPEIGFSRAVRVGDRVLVSGTGPVWPDGSCDPDAEVQARRCLEIIETALTEAGATLADVVRTRMFITTPDAAAGVSRAHGAVFGEIRPAATMIIVAGLLDPRWVVEIEAEARPGSA